MLDVPYASVVSRIIITINLWSSEEDLITLIISYFTQSMHFCCYLALNTCLDNTDHIDLQFQRSYSLLLAWLNREGSEHSQMLGWEISQTGSSAGGNPSSRRVLTWEYDPALWVIYLSPKCLHSYSHSRCLFEEHGWQLPHPGQMPGDYFLPSLNCPVFPT